MSSLSKFKINYESLEQLNLDKLKSQYVPSSDDNESLYNPFNISVIQNYIPTYDIFFNMKQSNYNEVSLIQHYYFVDLFHVSDKKNIYEKNVFIKYSPLLDPIKYMVGKYDLDDDSLRKLPTIENQECNEKISSKNNSSYVDNFFSYLCSRLLHHYNFVNFVDYYGTHLCIQDKFKMNITDDYDYLHDSNFFYSHINKHWTITKLDMLQQFMGNNSRNNRSKVIISNEMVTLDDLEEINITNDDTIIFTTIEEIQDTILTSNDTITLNNDDSSDENDDSDSDDVYDSEEEGSNDEDDDEDEDDENDDDVLEIPENVNIFAYINNFPVQMICLEKCDGTMDSLFEEELMTEEMAISGLMQVIMILITLQKAFHFTHNDLHTNNIMYVNTDIEYLHYEYKNKRYKVPTYGKIYKIIDFGRSIYKFQKQIYCSDSFAPKGDAATQYNCKPFLNPNKPIIEPNMSFDLCRLGCSIFDFIFEDVNQKSTNSLEETIMRWTTDDKGVNILYKQDGSERYPDFKLYKMIARHVHEHTPENQLEFDTFKQFLNDECANHVMNIDLVHSYV